MPSGLFVEMFSSLIKGHMLYHPMFGIVKTIEGQI